MELQGKIILALPERSGVSARGEWKSQDFVVETHEAYPRKMVFSVFGADRLQRFNIQVGQEVLVSFDIDAHEYNGRWFNNIRAFDVNPHLQQVLLNHHLQKHRHPRLLSLHNQWKVRVLTIFLSKETDKMMRSSTMRDNQLKTAFFR